jgi:ribonuclease-3
VDGGLSALQGRLQHSFTDPQLLLRALTHRSFSADHNERLEFLGDSVLNLAVAALYLTACAPCLRGTFRACAPTWSSRTPCTSWR